ncbi:hypothetical protein CEXT_608831 [Caerostris extrusa]|uniref:Uncharacterized protein n=1 Tax=Caerostris extrusa TaxID=172846 RepID=A0AAV4TZL3_CAEEX|nr:hypothetical protein CEXT_608831 [Caerostris extrusa]
MVANLHTSVAYLIGGKRTLITTLSTAIVTQECLLTNLMKQTKKKSKRTETAINLNNIVTLIRERSFSSKQQKNLVPNETINPDRDTSPVSCLCEPECIIHMNLNVETQKRS